MGLLQHLAAVKGHLECVALLVERGAEVNINGKSGLVEFVFLNPLCVLIFCFSLPVILDAEY